MIEWVLCFEDKIVALMAKSLVIVDFQECCGFLALTEVSDLHAQVRVGSGQTAWLPTFALPKPMANPPPPPSYLPTLLTTASFTPR